MELPEQAALKTLGQNPDRDDAAARVQAEFVFVRQQANLLHQKRNLLKWRSDNNFKALSLKRSECNTLAQRIADLKANLEAVRGEKNRALGLRTAADLEASKLGRRNDMLQLEHHQVSRDLEEWRARRDGFEIEITSERRLTSAERRKRDSQYRLLQLAKNREKRLRWKIHLLESMNMAAHQARLDFDEYKKYEYKRLDLLRCCSDSV
ncbi:hypothetical protein CSUI_001893 [Cystoisospora suis]|uniref:Uncharacterized protein n=1 Tax=Cystoisospora suis TaxID=483139 RepID=A0A2C6L6T6_9APIC|nr:hypothetical protein CSUI_001893 [Cystoisospora suis]